MLYIALGSNFVIIDQISTRNYAWNISKDFELVILVQMGLITCMRDGSIPLSQTTKCPLWRKTATFRGCQRQPSSLPGRPKAKRKLPSLSKTWNLVRLDFVCWKKTVHVLVQYFFPSTETIIEESNIKKFLVITLQGLYTVTKSSYFVFWKALQYCLPIIHLSIEFTPTQIII